MPYYDLRKKNGNWELRNRFARRLVKVAETETAGTDEGWKLVQRYGGLLVVHRTNGRIRHISRGLTPAEMKRILKRRFRSLK
jgi:hypothetical protein